jgi:hypothetical protein
MKCLMGGIYTEMCPQGSPQGEGADRRMRGSNIISSVVFNKLCHL